MNIMDLLNGSDGLVDSLKDLGIPEDKLGSLSELIGAQLGGGDGFDFGDLLGGLDLDGFLGQLDVPAIAGQLGLAPDLVAQAVALIGDKVDGFSPGLLGGLAGKLFS